MFKKRIACIGLLALAAPAAAQNDVAALRRPASREVEVKWTRSLAPAASTSFRVEQLPDSQPKSPAAEKLPAPQPRVDGEKLPVPRSLPSGNPPLYPVTPGTLVPSPATSAVLIETPASAVSPIPLMHGDVDCKACGPQGRFWFEGEYLFWWMRGSHTGSLVTASPPGTPLASAGVLGAPGTVTLFGNRNLNNDLQSGFQFRGGLFLDDAHRFGLEAGFIYSGGTSDPFTAGSLSGDAIISRPFVNALTGAQDAELVSYPGVLAGGVAVDPAVSQFWGYDVLLRRQLCCTDTGCSTGCDPSPRFNSYRRWDLIGGYRHFDFSDRIGIVEALTPIGGGVVPGTQIVVRDSFQSRSRFDGFVLGIGGQAARDRWMVQGALKIDIGQVTRQTSIWGDTTVLVPGAAPTAGVGGLYALGSNIGTYRNTDWTFLPEAELKVGYRITERLTAFAGYNIIVWPKVARASEQIDRGINTNQLPPPILPLAGPARPVFYNNTSTLWMQGLSVGLNWQF